MLQLCQLYAEQARSHDLKRCGSNFRTASSATALLRRGPVFVKRRHCLKRWMCTNIEISACYSGQHWKLSPHWIFEKH